MDDPLTTSASTSLDSFTDGAAMVASVRQLRSRRRDPTVKELSAAPAAAAPRPTPAEQPPYCFRSKDEERLYWWSRLSSILRLQRWWRRVSAHARVGAGVELRQRALEAAYRDECAAIIQRAWQALRAKRAARRSVAWPR